MSMVPGGFPMPANIRHIYFSTRSTKKGEIAGGHVLLEINQCTGEGTPSVHPNVAPHSSLHCDVHVLLLAEALRHHWVSSSHHRPTRCGVKVLCNMLPAAQLILHCSSYMLEILPKG
uniref:Uncharacterized protein n=1 Tax=Opuntia streptacantha TaxID=393608 RepID=A0A7C9CJZ0_OPUST